MMAIVGADGAQSSEGAWLALPYPNFKDGGSDGRHSDRLYLRVEDARPIDGGGQSVGRSLLRRLVVAHFRQPCGALRPPRRPGRDPAHSNFVLRARPRATRSVFDRSRQTGCRPNRARGSPPGPKPPRFVERVWEKERSRFDTEIRGGRPEPGSTAHWTSRRARSPYPARDCCRLSPWRSRLAACGRRQSTVRSSDAPDSTMPHPRKAAALLSFLAAALLSFHLSETYRPTRVFSGRDTPRRPRQAPRRGESPAPLAILNRPA